MSTELLILLLTVALGIIQLLTSTQAATAQRGLKWNISSRESSVRPLHGAAGRLDRAFKNFTETFPFFVAAIVIVHFAGTHNSISALGAKIYFAARLLYFPTYGFGIPILRSLLWLVSIIGLGMVLVSPFLAISF